MVRGHVSSFSAADVHEDVQFRQKQKIITERWSVVSASVVQYLLGLKPDWREECVLHPPLKVTHCVIGGLSHQYSGKALQHKQ